MSSRLGACLLHEIPTGLHMLPDYVGPEVKTLDPEKELWIRNKNFGSGVKTLDPE